MKEHIRIILFLLVISIIAFSCHQAVVEITEKKVPVIEQPKPTGVEFQQTVDLTKKTVYSAAVADFNNDGYDDIAAGIFDGNSLIFINNKDGTFTEQNLTDKKYFTEAIAAFDFNNDGDIDIILGNNQQPIVIMQNNGEGKFSLYKELEKNVVKDIAVADFDKDGYEDFVTGTRFKENAVYFNNNGDFEKVKFSESLPVQAVEAGDINNDGYADFATGAVRKTTKVYLNEKDRKFVLHAELNDFPSTEAIALSDINRDGRKDIVQGNNNEANVVYFNKESGFEKTLMFSKGNTYALIAADFDNDNVDEIVVGNYEEYIRIYKKIGNEYELVKTISQNFKNYIRDLAVGDFNNDNKLDLVAAREKELTQVYIS